MFRRCLIAMGTMLLVGCAQTQALRTSPQDEAAANASRSETMLGKLVGSWRLTGTILETLLPNGKRNPAAGIMFALLAEMARAERETLSERIKSGLQEARRKGRKLGRPAGSKDSTKEFLAKHPDIIRRLKEGQSVRNTAKITGKGGSTVQRVKAAMTA